ncbi:hypothetical protein [Fournierella sp.]|uniref:hypothetical protein n=1 Tax=Allofournierella sp. TaxID=1940256 RepID=UPI00307AA16E
MKKLMSVFVSVLMALSIGATCAFADSAQVATYGVSVPGSGENPTPYAENHCGSYANHDMLSHGWGNIVNKDTGKMVVQMGACAQCTRCNLVIVTQNDPGGALPLGYYTTWQPNEGLSSDITTITQTSNNIKYTSSKTIPGMSFRYAS